jgi:hypothetical protein
VISPLENLHSRKFSFGEGVGGAGLQPPFPVGARLYLNVKKTNILNFYTNHLQLFNAHCMNSGFRRGVNEICTFGGLSQLSVVVTDVTEQCQSQDGNDRLS